MEIKKKGGTDEVQTSLKQDKPDRRESGQVKKTSRAVPPAIRPPPTNRVAEKTEQAE